MELIREGDKTYLYDLIWRRDRQKNYPRKKGYFFMEEGKFCFQFAGKSFQMSGSKKYESTLKLIDIPTKSWIAVNRDRKGQRKSISCIYLPYVLQALQFELVSLITEE